jgi:hypothetical protein
VPPAALECVLEYMTRHIIGLEQRNGWRGHERTQAGLAWTRGELIERAFWPAGVFERPWSVVLDRLRADVPYIQDVIRKGNNKARVLLRAPRVSLSSIHAAKGGEADHVVLLTNMSTLTRKELQQNPDVERRVFYVGVTRARDSLLVVGNQNPLF